MARGSAQGGARADDIMEVQVQKFCSLGKELTQAAVLDMRAQVFWLPSACAQRWHNEDPNQLFAYGHKWELKGIHGKERT